MQRHMSPQSLSPSRQSRGTSLGHIGQSRACKAIFSSNTGTNNGICRRRTCVMASGSDEFCRDKVGAPVEKVAVEGESSISFLGGGGHSVDIKARKDTYILDSGLDCGLELPFTCRGGICGACVGRVVEGEVDQTDVCGRGNYSILVSCFVYFTCPPPPTRHPLKKQKTFILISISTITCVHCTKKRRRRSHSHLSVKSNADT